jgi:protein required for attachment to host cells
MRLDNMDLLARTDFAAWDRNNLDRFAREAADELNKSNMDAKRFVFLATIALNQDDVAAEKLHMVCPDPKTLDELRRAIDTVMLKEES